MQPNTPLDGMPLGWPARPEDLFVDAEGEAVRIDKAFSWEYPLAVHGLMHNVITNAWRGDPYPIDTLFLFMANMAWNSTMNTVEVRQMLADKDEDGEYKIPFLVVCDTFASETVAFADLVLPDTSYLERHDVLSMLDRPISEFDGPVDCGAHPGAAAQGRVQALPGGADRTGLAAQAAGLRHAGRQPQVPRLSGFHRQLRDLARLRHRLPRRLARQGRREVPQGRAQSPPVGDVRRERLLLSPRTAAQPTSTCATGTRAICTGRAPMA